jgi:hypothetical protein
VVGFRPLRRSATHLKLGCITLSPGQRLSGVLKTLVHFRLPFWLFPARAHQSHGRGRKDNMSKFAHKHLLSRGIKVRKSEIEEAAAFAMANYELKGGRS